jgi:hypothetical protein
MYRRRSKIDGAAHARQLSLYMVLVHSSSPTVFPSRPQQHTFSLRHAIPLASSAPGKNNEIHVGSEMELLVEHHQHSFLFHVATARSLSDSEIVTDITFLIWYLIYVLQLWSD